MIRGSWSGSIDVEADLPAPDYVRTDTTAIDVPVAQRSQSFFAAFDCTIPASPPEGVIFEYGGANGIGVAFRSSTSDIRLRASGSSVGSLVDRTVSVSGLLGQTGTMYFAGSVSTGEIALWWLSGTATLLIFDNSTTFFGFSGSNEGAFGGAGGGSVGGAAVSPANATFTGTFTEGRLYMDIEAPASLP